MVKGVFLPHPAEDSNVLIRCLQELLLAYPFVKFSPIYFDKRLKGYKIYFSEWDDSAALDSNCLLARPTPLCIYPLTSILMIHNILDPSRPGFEDDLQDTIVQRFGKVLNITKIEKTSRSESWKVAIDIPEFVGLDLYQQKKSSNMLISLPKWGEELEVTFWCNRCEVSGHFEHTCSTSSEMNAQNGTSISSASSSETHRREDEKRSTQGRSEEQTQIKEKEVQPENSTQVKKEEVLPGRGTQAQSNSRSPPRNKVGSNYGKKIQKKIDSIALKLGVEAIHTSGVLSNENDAFGPPEADGASRSKSSTANRNALITGIKEETDDQMDADQNSSGHHPVSRNSRTFSNEEREEESSNLTVGHNNDDSDDSDDIQVLDANSSYSSFHASNSTARDVADNSEESSMSPTHMKNSTTPDRDFQPGRASFGGRNPPVSRVEVTSNLSERLQECINEACDFCGVLDRCQLDAFLIHVKKKSNPIRVALNFTKNAKGLKEQLKKIQHTYYNTPQTGTKEDLQFIKWLNGLIERFDGAVPRKRKRNE